MDAAFLAMSVLGVAAYLVVALSGIVLTMEAYSKMRSRLVWIREVLLVVIAVMQMYGLIAIAYGSNDYTLWFFNRVLWLAFGTLSLVLAVRAFRGWAFRFFLSNVKGVSHGRQ
jgi:hypothetical protein